MCMGCLSCGCGQGSDRTTTGGSIDFWLTVSEGLWSVQVVKTWQQSFWERPNQRVVMWQRQDYGWDSGWTGPGIIFKGPPQRPVPTSQAPLRCHSLQNNTPSWVVTIQKYEAVGNSITMLFFYVKTRDMGAGELAQSMQCLPWKHGDLPEFRLLAAMEMPGYTCNP